MRNAFFEFFPVPKFLDPPAAGLSISGNSISYVYIEQERSGKVSLKGYDRVELPVGLIENGEIVKTEEIIGILSEFRRKNGLNLVKVNLPEEKAFLFRTTIPPVNQEEAREAIQFKIEENVPLSAGEAIFDFFIMEKGAEENRVVVSVLPQKTAYDYLDVLSRSGLTPVSFEVESQAVTRSIVKDGDDSPYLIVNVEKERVGLYAVEKGLIQFTSTINIGKDFFKNFSSVATEESKLPNEIGSERITIRTTESEEGKTLKEEAEKLLSYWNSFGSSLNSSFKVKKILTCGDVVLDSTFKKYFSSYFNLPMETANVWVNAFSLDEYVPDLPYRESLKYAAAVGLALPEFQLLKPEKKINKHKKQKTKNV